ncbi:hypothetical protein [Yersinia rochesterensis]|uniref:hypothetical protein n=1 Tax=Yersinia TaxID=629 RepID=UPI0011A6A526|nr:hypothetical protein [Yersinia rochesterensis]HDL6959468.1 hypothetical protein [Yersinia enterocolitica]HDL6983589.1 hypothetical protein [Yersinia enterocolitica]HDL7066706.1 hypothetical protein [Yersinia enterocolitica]HDL7071092.1 hypothetical protein [Yersinia enterocolitica]HDL7089538.1 hypothetical protein [Yersinia enterocolitica]
MTNIKKTSSSVASQAAQVLKNPNASAIQKQLAGSALSQAGTSNQTGAHMEEVASKVLTSPKYSEQTKTLAGSVLSQANKSR